MRALRILLVAAILLLASRGYGAVSDPNELVENSRVDVQVQAVWNRVTEKVSNWFNQTVESIAPSKSKPALNDTSAATPAPVPPAPTAQTATADVSTGTAPVPPTATTPEAATPTATTPAAATPAAATLTATTPAAATPTATAHAAATPAATAPTETTPTATTPAAATPTATTPAATPAVGAVQVGPTRAEQIKQLTASLPATTGEKKVTAKELQEARRQLHSKGAASVAKAGRKGKSNLKLSKTGVPVFPIDVKQTVKLPNGKTKVVMAPLKKIPRLDIGEEPTVGRNSFLLKDYKFPLTTVQNIPALPSPAVVSDGKVKEVARIQVQKAEPAKDMDKGKHGIDKIVTRETINKVKAKITDTLKVVEKPYGELSETQLKMLSALILFNQGDRCYALLGLFDSLSKVEKLSSEANFHLGLCAQQLKMSSLSFDRLSTLVRSENREFGAEALEAMVKSLPAEYEVRLSKLVRGLKDTKLISDKIKDQVNYITAKGAFKEGDFATARTYAEKISEKSPQFASAAYLIGIAWYSLGNTNRAMAKLDGLRQWMAENKVVDKNLNSLTAINLARMKFTQNKFKDALALYMAVDKDHPTWVQGLIEQGWAQLALEDYSGAIGNMYSLHSPYFKAVYKPESFAVRTIGYLNICQYGDAYKTLSWLEGEYRPWSENVSKYVQSHKLASQYYDTTVSYLKGKSSDNTDGLPAQIIREMARQKVFLNHQASINEKADEVGRYDGLEKIIKEERGKLAVRIKKATSRFKELESKLARAEKDKSLAQSVEDWKRQSRLERDLIIGLKHQSDMLEQSRLAWVELRAASLDRVDKERYVLREAAARNLVDTLNRMKADMTLVLENNEFLRYEVFAGSGENIRYQVAGGDVGEANRLPANVKPTKLMNWSFDGEYWEDEIGSYRSSLQNNCPTAGKMDEFFKAQNQEKESDKAAGQAALEKGEGK